MCLIISSAIHDKRFGKYRPIKIKKDFTVYKIIKANWNEEVITRVWSPIQYFIYDIGTIYCTKFSIDGKHNNQVHNGFHSFIHNSIAESHSLYYSKIFDGNGLATCIIPKGSEVFLSSYGEIVSNKIKIIGVKEL